MVQSEEVMVSTALVFEDIISEYRSSMVSYTEWQYMINILLLVGAIILLLGLYFICWRPYLNNLNNNLWRTKGMLKMIPMKAILNNEALKKGFIKGDLIQAVK